MARDSPVITEILPIWKVVVIIKSTILSGTIAEAILKIKWFGVNALKALLSEGSSYVILV